MIQNIKNNYTKILDSKLYFGKYYDFMLYKGERIKQSLMDIENMAIADFSTMDIASGILYSTVTWSNAINDGVVLKDIGMTGVDNGFISFKKDRISNQDFLNLYFNSEYEINSGDTRFFMTPVTGNTQEHNYPMYLVEENGEKYLSMKGGFYQGFVKLEGFDYQVLPTSYNKEYMFHFEIRPRSDYETDETTVNATHPDNSGIFFFIGARAENKFWPFYKTSDSAMSKMLKAEAAETYFDGCGEASGETYDPGDNNVVLLNEEWLADELPQEPVEDYFAIGDDYFSFDWTAPECGKIKPSGKTTIVERDDEFVGTNYLNTYDYQPDSNCGCGDCKKEDKEKQGKCDPCCNDFFGDDYFEDCPDEDNGKAIEDAYLPSGTTKIDANGKAYADSEGRDITGKGYYEIESDNKFLMFDQTDNGYKVSNWEEGTTVRLYGKKNLPSVNYFLLMNHTPTGYTIHNIHEYEEETGVDCDIHKDIRNNVFALRVTEDGAIGYRYGVLNCDEGNEDRYEVKEEYSKPGIVKKDQWNSINVRFAVINPAIDKCDNKPRKMRLMIYVNGFLVFISKELDTLMLKPLDEIYQKQEGVPYNISLGGGSLGLMETILPNYYAISDYILPIERDFCGTFIGDIRSFKIYEGFINYSAIANYLS